MPATATKTIVAKFAGKCADCATRFPAGTEIRYDGQAHCADSCAATLAPIRAERQAERQAQLAANQAFAALSPVEKARLTLQRAIEELNALEDRHATGRLSPFQHRMRDSHFESANMRIRDARRALAMFDCTRCSRPEDRCICGS